MYTHWNVLKMWNLLWQWENPGRNMPPPLWKITWQLVIAKTTGIKYKNVIIYLSSISNFEVLATYSRFHQIYIHTCNRFCANLSLKDIFQNSVSYDIVLYCWHCTRTNTLIEYGYINFVLSRCHISDMVQIQRKIFHLDTLNLT